ncbi:MAG TPA: hypothetical protein VH189_08750, partial [Rhizomicrobium sp.]|nr:hypothetical protein [Rhizomicrobium sp.]
MNKPVLLLASMLAIGLAGCSTPVPQVMSPQLVPKRFTGPVMPQAPVWPKADWWQGFGNPALTALVVQAQEGNRDLAAAAARVMQAEAQSTIQRAQLFPQIGGQAEHVNGGCSGQACQQFGRTKAFGLTFNASYELDFWGLARDNLR